MEANESSLNFADSIRGSQPPTQAANFIGNFEDFEESLDPSVRAEVQPTIRTQTNVRSTNKQVMASDLRNFVRSKEDLYVILSIEGQFHLPPFDECTMEFMRDALSGKKRLLTNREVASVNVPRYKEFNTANLYKAAIADEELRHFLPDAPEKGQKSINRKFLFNVS
jgi:hypothetical protein